MFTKNKNIQNSRNIDFKNNNDFELQKGIDISTYEYFFQLSSDNFREKYLSADAYSADVDIISKKLDLYFKDTLVETFQISETVINPLLEKKDKSLESEKSYNSSVLLSNEDMTFYLIGLKYDLKLILNYIRIRNPEWIADGEEDSEESKNVGIERMPSLNSLYVDGYVLVKKK